MNRLRSALLDLDHFQLVARLSLLLLIVNTNEQPVAFAVAVAATTALFLRPNLMSRPLPWIATAGVVGSLQLSQWWLIDDHVAVTTYWILAIGISRLARQPAQTLATSARLLIGIVFALAFAWKVLSAQFVSTDFFRFQLATDERFALVAEHLAGTDDEMLVDDRAKLGAVASVRPAGSVEVLAEGPRHREVALVFTAWGIAIEGLIGFVHLVPLRGRWRHLRLGSLFAFGYTTYAVVPVAGFGALLMTLGLAMYDSPRSRIAIVASAAVFLVWGAVFPALI